MVSEDGLSKLCDAFAQVKLSYKWGDFAPHFDFYPEPVPTHSHCIAAEGYVFRQRQTLPLSCIVSAVSTLVADTFWRCILDCFDFQNCLFRLH